MEAPGSEPAKEVRGLEHVVETTLAKGAVNRRRLGEDPEESDGSGERDQAMEAGDKETAPLLASREGEIGDLTLASGEG